MRTANPSKCSECKTEQDTDVATELHSAPSEQGCRYSIIIRNMSISIRSNIHICRI